MWVDMFYLEQHTSSPIRLFFCLFVVFWILVHGTQSYFDTRKLIIPQCFKIGLAVYQRENIEQPANIVLLLCGCSKA